MYSLSGGQELLLALATSTMSLCLNFGTIWTTSRRTLAPLNGHGGISRDTLP
ncbi:hypothetical protein DAPPUDRAFT_251221 [Daphnia pulex]|uniref:Uncharacterized protein n=1 Tax=Daphnia pulex TaxID=6669 RepID=E9GZZ1_DAPPU|nr:hypothetical protein DAPPUDRAFT_251221 [Daphnia pulex]|eukprot:EFX74906.1 hypothetical protein DAPPUDRAFT_251221 [Daphnia pulex]